MFRIVLLIVISMCSACYRMPEEGEVSVVPHTNNPQFTSKGSPQSSPFKADY